MQYVVPIWVAFVVVPIAVLAQNFSPASDPGGDTKQGESGTTYYFSWSSGDDANDCRSTDKPCKTGEKLESLALNAGDTVLFKRGDVWLNDSVDWLVESESGQEGKSIVYGAYGTGDRPVFRFDGNRRPSINIDRKAYLQIDRLDFDGIWAVRYRRGTHHVDTTYTRVRNSSGACIQISRGAKPKGSGKRSPEPHHLQFLNVRIENCGRGDNNGEGFYVSHSKDAEQRGGRDILIKDCHITGATSEPINVKYETRRVVVDGCLIEDNHAQDDQGIYNASTSDQDDAGNVLKNSIIRNNTGTRNEFNAAIFLGRGTIAFNNVIYSNKNVACIRGIEGSRAYFNTCFNNDRGFFEKEGRRGPGMKIDDVNCNIGGSLGNNIDIDSSLFTDVRAGDFRLKKSTLDMRGGCRLSGTKMDILGAVRSSNHFNFGAYEFRHRVD